MTDNPSDVRLRSAELQMRRALGLDRETPLVSQPTHLSNPSNGLHQRRQFVRDGDVPVTIVHGDSGSRLQQLDAARQALRQQTAAREEAERLLAEARNTIHDLETKLGHERLAKDEVTQQADAERQKVEEALIVVQEELAAERALRARAERERDEAAVARQTRNNDYGKGQRSKLRCHLLHRFPPIISRHDVVVGLRRSPGRMLPQTIRRSWNGGRQGGRRNTGSLSLMQPPLHRVHKPRPSLSRNRDGSHSLPFQHSARIYRPSAAVRRRTGQR